MIEIAREISAACLNSAEKSLFLHRNLFSFSHLPQILTHICRLGSGILTLQ
jgi:hypothetical protein